LKVLFVAFWALRFLGGVDGPGKEIEDRVAAITVKLVNRHAAPSTEGAGHSCGNDSFKNDKI
jgi:hypothetical protein